MVGNRPHIGLLAIIVILAVAPFAVGQQSWDGLATVARFGEFPSEGLYGATNVVEPNTLIEVRNLDGGATARLIVASGTSEPGVLLVISSSAARALGITSTGTARVRIRTVQSADVLEVTPSEEQALHPDPDINPLAFSGEGAVEIPPAFEPSTESEPPSEDESALGDEPESEPELATEPEQPESVVDAQSVADEETPETSFAPIEPSRETDTSPLSVTSPSTAEREPAEAGSAEAVPPTARGPRSGIASGVARTAVGQAQQQFERPEAAFVGPEPDAEAPLPVAANQPVPPQPEPEAEPEVVAEAATEQESVVQPQSVVETGPDPSFDPLERTVGEGTDDLALSSPEQPAAQTEVGEARPDAEPEEAAAIEQAVPDGVSRIQLALQELTSRLPQKELAAPPESRAGMGFIDAPPRPRELDGETIEIAEVVPPSVEVPTFSAFGMLTRDDVDDLTLAEAEVPDIEVPRPVMSDLEPGQAPSGEALDPSLAEASPPAPDTPEVVERLAAPTDDPFGTELAEADLDASSGVEAEPEESIDVAEETGPDPAVEPPIVPVVRVQAESLPVARVEGEVRPDLADVERPEAPDDDEPVELVEAGVSEPDRPTDSLEAPEPPGEGEPVELVEAGVTEPARPSESLEAPSAPVEVVDADPAEPREESESAPDLADLPPVDATEGEILLTLEPADFRPPEQPDVSTPEREAPGEQPQPLVAESEPDPDRAGEDESPTEIVSATEAREPEDTEGTPEQPPPTGALPIVPELAENSFYLQVGAYNSPEAAQTAVTALSATYPLAVVSSAEAGRAAYRVLVGPLAEDETGTALYLLRASGYSDSFVRRGNEL